MRTPSEITTITYKATYNPNINKNTKIVPNSILDTDQTNVEDIKEHNLDEPALHGDYLKNSLLEWAKIRSNDNNDTNVIMFANDVFNNISLNLPLVNQQVTLPENISDNLVRISQKTLGNYPNISSALGYANNQDTANACAQVIRQSLQSEINTHTNNLVAITGDPSGRNLKNSDAGIVTSLLEMLGCMETVLQSSAIQATVSANIARATQMLNDLQSLLGSLQKIYGAAGAKKVKDTDNKSDYTDWNDANRKYFDDAAKDAGSDFNVVDITNHNSMETEKARLSLAMDQILSAFKKNGYNKIFLDEIIEASVNAAKVNPSLTSEEKVTLRTVLKEGLDSSSITVYKFGDRWIYWPIQNKQISYVPPEEYNKYKDIQTTVYDDGAFACILTNMALAKTEITTRINNLPAKDIDFEFKDFGFSIANSAIPESLRGFFSVDPGNTSNIIISKSDIYSTNKSSDAVIMATGALAFVSQIVAGIVCSKSDSSIAGSYSDKYTNSNQLNNMISGINSYSQQVNNVANSLSSMISTLSNVSQQIAQTGSGMINTGQQSYNSLASR